MTITGTKLGRALRAKFKTPQAALRALGLDSRLLRGGDEELEQAEQLLLRRGMRVADIQKLIDTHTAKSDPRGGGGSIVGSEHADDHDLEDLTGEGIVKRFGSYDGDPPIERPASQQYLGGDDSDYDDFRRHLSEHGMDEEAVEKAVEIAKDARRRGGANGRDKNFGRDVLPRTASGVAERGGGMGGHITGGRTEPVHAMDQAHKKRLHSMFPHLARIQVEPEARRLSGDRRPAMDAAPQMTGWQRERMHRMFPDMARIRGSMDVGPSEDDRRRGKFEV